jgi:hypothetical protein
MTIQGIGLRTRIYQAIEKTTRVRLGPEGKRLLYCLLPEAALLRDRRQINGAFLSCFTERFVRDAGVYLSGPGLSAALEKERLCVPLGNPALVAELNLGEAYAAMVNSRTGFLAKLENRAAQARIIQKDLALQNLAQQLGEDPARNRKIAANCLHEVLGFSGVRVYSVDPGSGKWQQRHVVGEQGKSRFVEPGVPEPKSEKGHVTRLLQGQPLSEEVEGERAQGLWEWYNDGRVSLLYIPNRGRCSFVETAQIKKDEAGDTEQNREGYGEGATREILYLILQGKPAEYEVYMVTNWAAKKPLFMDKRQDAKRLHSFAASVIRAEDLRRALQKMKDEAIRDELTGCFNRRYGLPLKKNHMRVSSTPFRF